jgi:uncharacterized damage-inducible protein DinB
MTTMTQKPGTINATAVSSGELLAHWQGHRRLTRKVIEVFPEDKLFTHSIGGMRPFSELVLEFLGMAVPSLSGVVTGKWQKVEDMLHQKGKVKPTTKAELLERWDEDTEQISELWPQIPAHRFLEVDVAFGQWEGTGQFLLFYVIDNEIHHRAQGYVYLRSLGIEPPAFWDRG